MKTNLSIIFFLFALLSACNNTGSQETPSNEKNATTEQTTMNNATSGEVKNLSAAEFAQLLTAEPTAILLDVRTPEEYAEGHLKNATLMNIHDQNFAQKIAQLDKSKPVMVYCAAGGRSSDAAQQLQQIGFARVYNLAKGFNDWSAANMEFEK